jgi:hypothetical protein
MKNLIMTLIAVAFTNVAFCNISFWNHSEHTALVTVCEEWVKTEDSPYMPSCFIYTSMGHVHYKMEVKPGELLSILNTYGEENYGIYIKTERTWYTMVEVEFPELGYDFDKSEDLWAYNFFHIFNRFVRVNPIHYESLEAGISWEGPGVYSGILSAEKAWSSSATGKAILPPDSQLPF